MIRKWLKIINLCLAIGVAALLLSGFAVRLSRPGSIPLREATAASYPLPRHAFAQEQEAYASIGQPLLALQYVAPKMQLPDLRKNIAFYGQNGRPDAESDRPLLHLGINGQSNELSTTTAGEKLYLLYDKEQNGKYLFSPNNRETNLWVEAEYPGNGELTLHVAMVDENGEQVKKPEAFASFALKEKEYVRGNGAGNGNKGWQLDQWRVDGTLLARQRARWFGIDRFMEKHGGEEYKPLVGKQRIDFGEKEEAYSVYLGAGDVLIWNGSRWEAVEAGSASRGYPLLVVKKIDERLMNFELWDNEGKRKVPLNLLRSMETWVPQNFQDEFKFLGARTRSQYVFAVDDEKMLLKPDDWLLLTDEGWKKLNTVEEIDNYVDRKETGTLFVFEGIIKNDDQQVLKGTIFNATRTESHNLELPVQKDSYVYHNNEKAARIARNKEQKKTRVIATSSRERRQERQAS